MFPCHLLLLFFGRYGLFLNLDELYDLLGSKLNYLSTFKKRINEKPLNNYIDPYQPRVFGLDHVLRGLKSSRY